jgi:hypothetical protein
LTALFLGFRREEAARFSFPLRPLYMFYRPAILNGNEVQRFAKITDPDLILELQAIKARMYPDPQDGFYARFKSDCGDCRMHREVEGSSSSPI